MILLFNHIPVTLQGKINKFVEKVQEAYGSEFFNIQGQKWFGDKLSIKALFPAWILREYENDPTNILIVPIIKNYLRWLFSLEYGYGAQLNWENIRSPVEINSKMLEAIAECYFPGADFASDELSDLLPNIRAFSIQVQGSYFDIKGTPKAIKRVLTTLMGLSSATTQVYCSAPGVITIKANVSENHKPFLQEHVIPAGMNVIYTSP